MMTRTRVRMPNCLIKAAVVALVLAGCGGETANTAAAGATGDPASAAAARAKDVYVARCAMCHGTGGAGDTAIGSSYPAANLTDATWAYGGTKADVAKIVANGTPNGPMRGFQGILTPAEIDEVSEYVLSLAKK